MVNSGKRKYTKKSYEGRGILNLQGCKRKYNLQNLFL